MPGFGRAHRRDRVHAVRCRADDAESGPVAADRGLKALDDDVKSGLPRTSIS